jgi:hypothetical protein
VWDVCCHPQEGSGEGSAVGRFVQLVATLLKCLDQKREAVNMIRKLKSGQYRLYSRKKNPKTGRRRNLGTFKSRAAAEKHERAVQYFKHG